MLTTLMIVLGVVLGVVIHVVIQWAVQARIIARARAAHGFRQADSLADDIVEKVRAARRREEPRRKPEEVKSNLISALKKVINPDDHPALCRMIREAPPGGIPIMNPDWDDPAVVPLLTFLAIPMEGAIRALACPMDPDARLEEVRRKFSDALSDVEVPR